MDFARKILNKYGWKDGEGLGKNNNGIVKPLKASMKFDNAGLGSDQAASDFNNHWWERVFNEAAKNVDVTTTKNGVSVDLKNKDESVEISTKEYSVKKLKKAKDQSSKADKRYDNFLQSATLTKSGDEIENPNKIAVADISVKKYKTLTDEELFRACGGRTAHKGARHGLKLSGKLARIEQQEQELLAKIEDQKKKSAKNNSKQCLEQKLDVDADDIVDKKQKKIKNKSYAGHSEPTDLNVSEEINSITKVKKNKRKDNPEQKEKKSELATADVAPEDPAEVSETTVNSIDYVTKLKKNKRKDNPERKAKKSGLATADVAPEDPAEVIETTVNSVSKVKKNKRKDNPERTAKKKSELATADVAPEEPADVNETTIHNSIDERPISENNENSAKKNKKRKADHMNSELSDKTIETVSNETASKIKKKKKKYL
ncbi:G patch domain-containing protein 4 [Zeugodacus cucurbitae]|uniref:G patch domain-containing protein 4 n=1 Tax=Zeugodacus cucurbitae TaxID=28588 RepID=UPI0005968694|nr:G patch domain-containing protein 4 [Zeugodacus cucurbitae]